DEFGTRFDVANCSICLHWLNAGTDGAVIFSTGYEGCHVLLKEDRYVLRVHLEETLRSGVPVASYEVNMTCPQPGDHEVLTNGDGPAGAARGNGVHHSQADVLVPLAQPGLLHHASQSTLTLSAPQADSEKVPSIGRTQPHQNDHGPQSQPSAVGAIAQPQNRPGWGNSGGQTQPGLQAQNRPGSGGQTQPGGLRPGLQTQNRPGWGNSGAQAQPGGLRPGLQTQNQPGLVHSGGQNQPGLVHSGGQNQPGLQTPNRPGLVHSGGQNQPGLVHSGGQTHPGLRPGIQTPNQPRLVHSGGQNQPGLRPGLQIQNQPGLVHSGGQAQPGLRPGVQTPNRPGLTRSGGQNHPGSAHSGGQAQPGLRPGFQTPNRPGLTHSGGQNQPGSAHSGGQAHPGFLRPGLEQPGVQSGWTHVGGEAQAGYVRPGAQPQSHPGFARPNLQPQSQADLLQHGLYGQTGLVRPGRPQPALSRPGLQSQPGSLHPGLPAQPQPGLLRPGLQAQPGLLQPTALFYPPAGAGETPRGGQRGQLGLGAPLTREQCRVPVGRLACVAAAGRAACLQAGCCYDDMDRVTPCYYGNTATVQCLLEGSFVLVVPRGLATQPYNLDSVRLASSQPGCEPVRATETFVMFHFAVTQCGTTVQVVEDQLVYENQLISTIDVQGSHRGSITRDSTYILQARCIYNASELLPFRMEVAEPTTASTMTEPGPLGLQLRIATDETYTSYHSDGDHPLVKVLRDPIYVEVRLLQKTDPNLVLVLHHCWASPSTDAGAEPQWPILVDGCPFEGDNYRTQLLPVGPATLEVPFPSHYQRFVISTFTFVEAPEMAALEGEV
ncbi:ZP1 protein, partial [Piaya cayana]|nr:ZP1 protein [Piaya cayana]